MNMNGQIQFSMPLTRTVKSLIIANMVIWVGLILILQKWILSTPLIYQWFALIPESVLLDFHFWQPLTYMFLHSENVFHVLFNMLVLWWFGSELEVRWGARFFLSYYFVCGVGAGVLYLLGVALYALISGDALPLKAPVVGASGSVFGLMLAYGWLYGDRVIYFMMVFPLKARVFVGLIGLVEVLNLLSSGFSSSTANLAHLGGLVSGFLFLKGNQLWQGRGRRQAMRGNRRNLKLVVNNEPPGSSKPKYWN